MQDRARIVKDLREFIVSELSWSGSPEDLTEDFPLIDEGVVDSLGIFEIVQTVEGRYGVVIDDEEWTPENFENLASIAALVASKSA